MGFLLGHTPVGIMTSNRVAYCDCPLGLPWFNHWEILWISGNGPTKTTTHHPSPSTMSRTLALAAGVENARRVPLASTGAVEAVLSAAAVAPPRALSSASSGWNTPLPQSSAEDAVHLVGAEVMACAFLPVTACYRLLFFPSFFSLIMFFSSFTSLLEGGWRRFEDYTISRIFGLVTSDWFYVGQLSKHYFHQWYVSYWLFIHR